MQAMVVHFFDETTLFPWVPFIQMHMVINISLDLLIGTCIYINNFLSKRIVWLFINKKSFVSNNELLKSRNMDWLFDYNITKWKTNIDSHSKFVIRIQYIMYTR